MEEYIGTVSVLYLVPVLLPERMVKVKDFLVDGGSVSLYAEEAPSVRSV